MIGRFSEVMGGIPVGGKVYTTWLAWRSGDLEQTAGGVVDLAGDLLQMYLGVAAGALDDKLINVGLAGRLAALDGIGALGGHAALFISMAQTVVELYGHEAFAPIDDHFEQLVWKGYVDVQPAGYFFRVGTKEVDSRIPVTPLIEPQGHTPEFVYLKPVSAQSVFEDLQAAGKTQAANAMLHLLDYDENVDTQLDRPVMIDLHTDFAALTAEVTAAPIAADLPPALRDQLQMAKQRVIAFYAEQQALQVAILERIRADRELRRGVPDHLNLWAIAARENLGLALDGQFQREGELLYRSLLGMDEARETLAADSTAAWTMWRANATSTESEAALRQQFLDVFSPRQIFEAKQQALQSSGEALSGIPWGAPQTMLTEYLTRAALAWGKWERDEDIARREKLAAIEHQVAAMVAFRDNSYMNTRTPTQPYRLDDATAWFSGEIQQWRQFIDEIPTRNIRPEDRQDVRTKAKARLAAMSTEVGVVAAGFHAADEAVAPKIAQLHLMHWLAGEAPFDNDVHLGVKFVWHDAEVQARLRAQLVKDLIRGRKLIPTYRAQADSLKTLYAAEAMGVVQAYSLRSQIATRRGVRAGAAILESQAAARATTLELPGEMTLTAEPYLVKTGKAAGDGELQVAATIRVDHDILRAETVETKLDYRIVPFDKLDALPVPALERALRLSEIARDQVLCVVEVSIAVTKATPAKGYEASAYTTLPKQTWYLVVPGTPPTETADARKDQLVYPEKRDRTGEIKAFNAHEQVDLAVKTVYAGERLWAWFNLPATANYVDFEVVVKNASGEVVLQALNQHILGLPGDLEAGESAPATYCIPLWNKKIDKAGVYTVNVRPVAMGIGVTGGVGANASDRPWVTAATFELASLQVVYKGITAETVRNLAIKKQGLQGTLSLSAEGGEEPPLRLTLDGRWRSMKDGKLAGPEQRSTGIFTLALPKTLNLMSDTRRAAVQYALVSQSVGVIGTAKAPVDAMIYDGWLIHGAPKREMVGAFSGLPTWTSVRNPTVLPHFQQSGAADIIAYKGDTFSRTSALEGVQRERFMGMAAGPEEHGAMRLEWGTIAGLSGEPKLSLAWHFRMGQGYLYVPIRMRIKGFGDAIAYAVYGFEAGAYDGPGPEGGPGGSEAGDGGGEGGDVATTGDGRDDGGDAAGPGGDDATAGGIGPKGDIPRDPNAVDPNHPDVARLIREWLRIAEPPPNATVGAQLRFTPYGIWEGRTPTGTIRVQAPPDAAAGMTPEAYCWLNRATIDSVDHCTIGEWVMARLAGDTTACQGRYKRQPQDQNIRVGDYTGQRYSKARAAAMAAGHPVQAVAGDPATTAEGTGKVLSQSPAPGRTLAAREPLTLVIAGPYMAMVTIPDVAGLSRADALARLKAAGLQVNEVYGGEAPTAAEAGTVRSQGPKAGMMMASPARMEISIYGDYVPKVTVPDLRGLPEATAEARLKELRLRLDTRPGTPAQTAQQAGTVERQDPEAGAKLPPDSLVTVRLYSAFTPPQITVPDVRGLPVADADTRLKRVQLRLAKEAGSAAPTARHAGTVETQAPAAASMVPLGSVVTVRVFGGYTPPQVTVPDIRGLPVADADARLKRVQLRLAKEAGSAAPTARHAGTIETQTPAGGEMVPPGSFVLVRFYRDYVPPPQPQPQAAGTVPDFSNKTVVEAATLAQQHGVRLALRDGGPPPNAQLADRVAAQHPRPGTPARRDDVISLSIYAGLQPAPAPVPTPAPTPLPRLSEADLRTMPDLSGDTKEVVIALLTQMGMRIEFRVGDPPPRPNQAGLVDWHDPIAGAAVKPGQLATISLYQGNPVAAAAPAPAPVKQAQGAGKMPDLTGMTAAEARAVLDRLGLNLTYDFTFDVGARNPKDAGRMILQRPLAGTQLVRGQVIRVGFARGVPVGGPRK